jgi:hypothetical protein
MNRSETRATRLEHQFRMLITRMFDLLYEDANVSHHRIWPNLHLVSHYQEMIFLWENDYRADLYENCHICYYLFQCCVMLESFVPVTQALHQRRARSTPPEETVYL